LRLHADGRVLPGEHVPGLSHRRVPDVQDWEAELCGGGGDTHEIPSIGLPSSLGGRGRAMPSASLLRWQNDRMPRLAAVEAHCIAAAALVPPNPHLAEESLRSYVMLLSGHFQGFCRDLYGECSQACASAVPAGLLATVQMQFTA